MDVLIVDDQEAIRIGMKRMKVWTPHSNFRIAAEAKNGKEALEILETQKIDLIISDIRMPVIDGLSLLKAVTDSNLNIPVILISDHAEFEYARKGLMLGAFDYLVKPLKLEDLKKCLERLEVQINEAESKQITFDSVLEELMDSVKFGRTIGLEDWKRLESYAEEKFTSNYEEGIIKLLSQLYSNLLFKEILREEIDAYRYVKGMLLDMPPISDMASEMVFSLGDELIETYQSIFLPSFSQRAIRDLVGIVVEDDSYSISTTALSERVFVSRSYLSQVFKKTTGMTLYHYLLNLKMKRAIYLLSIPEIRVFEVAARLGYQDEEHFTTVFKKHYQMLPSEVTKKYNRLI